HDVDFTAFTGRPSEMLDLPSYPWDLQRLYEPSEEVQAMLNKPADHPLLGKRHQGAAPLWRNEISLKSHPWIEDHAVGEDVVFPGAGYIDMMIGAGQHYFGEGPIEIGDLEIAEALFIGYEDAILLETTIEPKTGVISIHSHLRDSPAGWILRARGRLSQPDVAQPEPVDIGEDAETVCEPLDARLFYALTARQGLQYGHFFQGIRHVQIHSDRVLADVEMHEDQLPTHFESHAAHPAVGDACLQCTAPLVAIANQLPLDVSQADESAFYPLYLPVGAQRVRYFGKLPAKLRVQGRLSRLSTKHRYGVDFTMMDEDGRPLLQIDHFEAQPITQEAGAGNTASGPRFYLERAQQGGFDDVVADPPRPTGKIHVLPDAGGIAAALAERLRAGGADVSVLPVPESPAALAESLETLALVEGEPATLISAFALDTPELPDDTSGEALQAAVERNVLLNVALGQKIDALSATAAPLRMWTLTAGSRELGDGATLSTRGLAQAPIGALLRTIGSENRALAAAQIDLRAEDDATLDSVARLILIGSPESELAVEGDTFYAFRLEAPEQRSIPMRRVSVSPTGGDTTFLATMENPGLIQDIVLEQTPAPQAGPGEAVVAIGAVGLNFRDIMAATGLLPREAESEPAWRNLGLEFGGTVIAVGEGVDGVAPGDRVMGMGRRCLQGQIVHPAMGLTKLPDNMSLVDAATVPSAFSTAHYALNHVARLQPGEKVLIHSATGGVGIAAIQLARRAGAEVFATCSASKRHHLEAMGIEHIFNSRSLDFADEIMERTGGAGVDVVLNSLPGDYITKGIDCLAPFGRFLEIGKRDVYANAAVGMKALRRNVSLSVIDLAAMGVERPDLLQRLSNEVVAMFAEGELTALP
ncbi:MAG: polyketide synthase dehydratase domain-containing protein, partial [Pseudomonadota bacterium]